jgi:hypothetical protein
MSGANDHGPSSEKTGSLFNLIPMDQAPSFVLPMITRFAEGVHEPMVIGANGRPVAALIPIGDFLRLRSYDQHALDIEDSAYSELDQRLQRGDSANVVTDLDAFAKSLGPVGQQWVDRRSRNEHG